MELSKIYQRIAPFYDPLDYPFEIIYYKELRKFGISQLRNEDILEIGVGTGKNLPYYHKSNQITAIDFSVEMLSLAKARSQKLDLKIELIHSSIQDFQINKQFTTIVATFVLYLQEDLQPILEKLNNLLIDTGKIILIEYKLPSTTFYKSIAKLLSKITYPLFGLRFENINTLSYLLRKFTLQSLYERGNGMLYCVILSK